MAGFRHRKGIEVGCLFRKFLTSASFTTLRLDDHDVIQILDPPVASYFAALASESGIWIAELPTGKSR